MNSNSKDPETIKTPKVLRLWHTEEFSSQTQCDLILTADEPVSKLIAAKHKKAVPLPRIRWSSCSKDAKASIRQINFEDLKIVVPKVSHEDETKNRIEIFEESEGLSGFSKLLKWIHRKRLMNFILKRTVKRKPRKRPLPSKWGVSPVQINWRKQNAAIWSFSSSQNKFSVPPGPNPTNRAVSMMNKFSKGQRSCRRQAQTSAERNQKYLVALYQQRYQRSQKRRRQFSLKLNRFDEKGCAKKHRQIKRKRTKGTNWF